LAPVPVDYRYTTSKFAEGGMLSQKFVNAILRVLTYLIRTGRRAHGFYRADLCDGHGWWRIHDN
jgi:hypothetical protein